MANFVYTPFKTLLGGAGAGWAAGDIRALLVMTNTTADTEQDMANIADITTLDEFDGANYARVAFTGEANNEDTANNRAELDVADLTGAWTDLGNGTRQAAGLVVYKHVTNDADAILVAYIDTLSGATTFPFNPAGATINITINAEGLVQIT